MILESAELHQICQYEHFSVKLKPGLIGILGPNGAGKSNLVNMLKASLTGDFSVNPGVKDDNIRWGMPADDYSAVTSKWNIANDTFTVRRALAGTHNYLHHDGKEIRGIKEINAEIERILGIPKQALNFMFVAQWEMFAFISADPAVRSAMFSHLCGTAKVEKIHKLVGDEVKASRTATESIRDNREEIKQQILERTARILEFKKQLKQAVDQVLTEDHYNALQDLIQNYDERQTLLQRLDAATTRAVSVQRQLIQHETELSTATAFLDASTENIANAAAKAAVAEKELAERIAQTKAATKRDVLQSILDEYKHPVPPAPELYDDRQLLEKEFYELKQEIADNAAMIKLFESGEHASCPTCQTPTKNLVKVVAERKKLLPMKTKRVAVVQEILRSCTNYDAAMKVYNEQSAAQRERKAAAKAELQTLPPAIDPNTYRPMEVLRALIKEHQDLVKEHDGYVRRRSRAEIALATAQGALAKIDEDIINIGDELNELEDTTIDNTQEAVETMAIHEESLTEITICKARIADLEELNKAQQAEIDRITKLLEATVDVRAWVADLDEAKDTSHRDNFPKIAAQHWLSEMTDKVNETLQDFDSPFRVEAAEDLSFIAIKPDGRRERADRLSGGQKMLLALAFRFAVNALLAGDLGMMILDEPTAGVDKTNVNTMTDILKRLSSYTKEKGRQIIIITHDETLQRAFDQVICIDKQQ